MFNLPAPFPAVSCCSALLRLLTTSWSFRLLCSSLIWCFVVLIFSPPPLFRLHLFVCFSVYKCTYVFVCFCGGAWIHVATLQQGKLTTTARMWRNSPRRTSGSCSWRRLSKTTTKRRDGGRRKEHRGGKRKVAEMQNHLGSTWRRNAPVFTS